MSTKRPSRIAGLLFAATLLLSIASIVLELSRPKAGLQVFYTAAFVPVMIVFAGTGAVLVAQVPANAVGWLLSSFALSGAVALVAEPYAAYGASAGHGDLPGSVWLAWLTMLTSDTLAPALLAFSLLLFPTGRLPAPKWRWLALALVVATGIAVVSKALLPGRMEGYALVNPLGIAGTGQVLGQVAVVALQIVVLPLMLLSAVSLLARRRHARPVERQQLKWFAFAASLLAGDLLLVAIAEAVLPPGRGSSIVAFLVFVATLLALPVAMAVAILKYRLYDIDRIISRTLVYGALTAFLGATYFVAVILLQAVLGERITDQPLAVAATTLAVAALFRPARARIQAIIDRRFNRRKYDAERTIEAFGRQLRDRVDLDDLRDDLVAVVMGTMQPAHVSLWLLDASGEPNKYPSVSEAGR